MPEPSRDDGVAGRARKVPARVALTSLVRHGAHRSLVDIGQWADGHVAQVGLGVSQPYLITHPDHVQRILRDNAPNYRRDGKGMLWRSVRQLTGDGILGEGPEWEASRRVLQPLFTARRVADMTDGMAEAIGAAMDVLDGPARDGRVVDAAVEVSRIVCSAITKVFFGGRISVSDSMRVVAAQETIVTALRARLLLPWLPDAVPMPGDRALGAAVQSIDNLLLPVIREARREPGGDDIISTLCQARAADGRRLTEQQVRDDTVAMFATTTETTFVVLTWLWPVLAAHPHVAAGLREEIDRVVGAQRVRREHLAELRYTRMVLEELLRLYPAGWILPRTAVEADVVGGVRIERGATVVLSPYATQRMAQFWDKPQDFDPQRFSPEARRRHKYSYYPFGGGGHQCIGQHLFNLEAQLIVANMLSRFRIQLRDPSIPEPQVAASLRPGKPVEMTLVPIGRPAAR